MGDFVLERVSVHFGAVEALHDVSLRLQRGERAAIVGPSGGGKSTLLRLLVGAVVPTTGRVSSCGFELDQLSPAALRKLRAGIGFIHQHPGLMPNMRVCANLATGRLGRLGFLSGMRAVYFPSRQERQAMERLLVRTGVENRLQSRAGHLSGGQQQRVAIARALWQEPGALLADEPISSLDPARARAVLNLLVRICREDGLALVVSLHQFDLARELFPRLIGLRGGRIVFDRPSRDVGEAEFTALYQLTDRELAAEP